MSEEPVRLEDVVAALEKRGEHLEAFYYGIVIPLQLEAMHGIPFEQVNNMVVDDIVALLMVPPTPIKYRNDGWSFWWGQEAFKNTRN